MKEMNNTWHYKKMARVHVAMADIEEAVTPALAKTSAAQSAECKGVPFSRNTAKSLLGALSQLVCSVLMSLMSSSKKKISEVTSSTAVQVASCHRPATLPKTKGDSHCQNIFTHDMAHTPRMISKQVLHNR
jgi:hypothetical protein